jgi:DNA-directed RNA polymerase subunit RPC12/RpoP
MAGLSYVGMGRVYIDADSASYLASTCSELVDLSGWDYHPPYILPANEHYWVRCSYCGSRYDANRHGNCPQCGGALGE